MAVEFWDNVERQQVDNFLRESMARKFVIKGVGDKRQITKVLKNGRNWKKTVRSKDQIWSCKGSFMCSHLNCPYTLQFWHNK